MADDLDRMLARLADETEPLRPRPGFNQRVLASLNVDVAPSFSAGVVRFGRAMLAVAALSAVVGATVGFVNQRAADEAVAMTSSVEDLDW